MGTENIDLNRQTELAASDQNFVKQAWVIIQDLPASTPLLDFYWYRNKGSNIPVWNNLFSSLTEAQKNLVTHSVNALLRYDGCGTLADLSTMNFDSPSLKTKWGKGLGPKGRAFVKSAFLGEGFEEEEG